MMGGRGPEVGSVAVVHYSLYRLLFGLCAMLVVRFQEIVVCEARVIGECRIHSGLLFGWNVLLYALYPPSLPGEVRFTDVVRLMSDCSACVSLSTGGTDFLISSIVYAIDEPTGVYIG